ncbi:MAG: methyltransferase [archaeon]|nr:methyltransferase [archaeon]
MLTSEERRLLRAPLLTPLERVPHVLSGLQIGSLAFSAAEATRLCGSLLPESCGWGAALKLVSALNRSALPHALAKGPLVEVTAAGSVGLKGAPEVGFLQVFYPTARERGGLPLKDLLGVNAAWQRYATGVRFPGLERPLRPFFSVFAHPRRFGHLLLLDRWLRSSAGAQALAGGPVADVGTGCGVVALRLLARGVQVVAGDVNPNAVLGLLLEKRRMEDAEAQLLTVFHSDLFQNLPGPFSLVCFNPPWIPGMPRSLSDLGNYLPDDLLCRFFQDALSHLLPSGRIALMFPSLRGLAAAIKHKDDVILSNPVLDALTTTPELVAAERLVSPDGLDELWVLQRA